MITSVEFPAGVVLGWRVASIGDSLGRRISEADILV